MTTTFYIAIKSCEKCSQNLETSAPVVMAQHRAFETFRLAIHL